MKKLTVIMIVLFSFSEFSFGQQRTGGLSIVAGFPIPSKPEDLDTFWTNGFRGGIGYTHSIKPRVSVRGAFNYLRWSLDEEAVIASVRNTNFQVDESSGGTISVYDITGILMYALKEESEKLVPYLIGGIGLYIISLDGADGESQIQAIDADGLAKVKPGINLGIGADLALSEKVGLMFSAKWIMVFTRGDYNVDLNVFNKVQGVTVKDSQAVNLSGNTHAILINLGLRISLR